MKNELFFFHTRVCTLWITFYIRNICSIYCNIRCCLATFYTHTQLQIDERKKRRILTHRLNSSQFEWLREQQLHLRGARLTIARSKRENMKLCVCSTYIVHWCHTHSILVRVISIPPPAALQKNVEKPFASYFQRIITQFRLVHKRLWQHTNHTRLTEWCHVLGVLQIVSDRILFFSSNE